MPRGRRHEMGRGERLERAFELFAKGYSNVEVADDIHVHPDTVTRYRRVYESRIAQQAKDTPNLLRDVLGNTLRTLAELDRIRKEAWERYESASTDGARQKWMAIVLKAQDQRAKLFGLMGVKQDTLAYINGIKEIQGKLIEFMQRELCADDRRRLDEYIIQEFAEELAHIDTVADIEA